MTTDTKPSTVPAKPAPPAKPDYGKTIAVKSLVFYQNHPALNARTSIAAESAANRGLVSIEFIPSLRHHRLEMISAAGDARVLMIAESHVASWEPLP